VRLDQRNGLLLGFGGTDAGAMVEDLVNTSAAFTFSSLVIGVGGALRTCQGLRQFWDSANGARFGRRGRPLPACRRAARHPAEDVDAVVEAAAVPDAGALALCHRPLAVELQALPLATRPAPAVCLSAGLHGRAQGLRFNRRCQCRHDKCRRSRRSPRCPAPCLPLTAQRCPLLARQRLGATAGVRGSLALQKT